MEQEQSLRPVGRTGEPSSRRNAALLGGALLLVIVLVGVLYWFVTRNQVTTDKADIEAPIIAIASGESGTIEGIFVRQGDRVTAGTGVAEVSHRILKAERSGIVVSAEESVGRTVSSGEPVVTLIDPSELRVVAHVDENAGLSDVRVGQETSFAVDAFGSKRYAGIVEDIGQSARQSGVVFNISGEREIRQFDIRIRFDTERYPELRNGMSAKVTIYTK